MGLAAVADPRAALGIKIGGVVGGWGVESHFVLHCQLLTHNFLEFPDISLWNLKVKYVFVIVVEIMVALYIIFISKYDIYF